MTETTPVLAESLRAESGGGYPEPLQSRMGQCEWKRLGDPFGLTQRSAELCESFDLLVHPRIEPLTDREQEVLRLLSTGMNNRDIAAVLFIAESTVKTHVEHIIGKLGVSDRVQAAVWAARHGLASLPD
jgi:DNA-binding NarL/FixJ family response regulator